MDDVDDLAAAFAALSNPQRLRMFIKLASTCCAGEDAAEHRRRFCCATEVGAGLELAGSTVSHHLKELRQAGLMHVERHGRQIDCWASREMLERLGSFFAAWAPATSGSRAASPASTPRSSGARQRAPR